MPTLCWFCRSVTTVAQPVFDIKHGRKRFCRGIPRMPATRHVLHSRRFGVSPMPSATFAFGNRNHALEAKAIREDALTRYLYFCAVITIGLQAQQPRIAQVQNNYSYLLPDNPSYGAAQGSIFIIRGTDLAPSSTELQNVPLGTILNGVSARVTVNGTSTDVLWPAPRGRRSKYRAYPRECGVCGLLRACWHQSRIRHVQCASERKSANASSLSRLHRLAIHDHDRRTC